MEAMREGRWAVQGGVDGQGGGRRRHRTVTFLP